MTAPTRNTGTRAANRASARTAEQTRRGRAAETTRKSSTTSAGEASVEAPAKPTRADRPARAAGRPRTAAAERAYARRAHREGRGTASRPAVATEEVTSGRASFVVLIIALLVVGVAATLWLTTQAIADSYRLEDAKNGATRLSEQAAQLQREVTRQESASALAQRARELGMVPAGDPAWLVVQPDGSVTVVGEAKPVPAPAPPTVPVDQQPAAPVDSAQPPAAGGQAAPPAGTVPPADTAPPANPAVPPGAGAAQPPGGGG
ncbi:hypothetical protein [Actinokineospora sp.]|uniref:hypothetical protein n=1 Tax=Actinokineospora sp. TaxID=1872133 RepID=UPI004037C9C7